MYEYEIFISFNLYSYFRVVCVAVSGRPSELEFPGPGGHVSSHASERLSLKWSAHVAEVEVVEGTVSGTLARLTTGGGGATKKSSLTKTNSTNDR